MESLLPSEIARLVYGYLRDEGCCEAADKFLQSSPHLGECQKIAQQGRRFHSRVMGRSLTDMLDVFSTVYSIVHDRVDNSQEIISNSALVNCFQQLLNAESSKQNLYGFGSAANRVSLISSSKAVDGRCPSDSVLKPHATSTPYSNVLPNGCPNDVRQTAPTTSNTSVRRQLLSEKENEKVVDQEALQVYINSLNRTLLDSTQIHEKLAEKINEKITAVENQPSDTIVKNIVTEIDFDSFVDDIMESANPYEEKSKDHSIFKDNNFKPLEDIEHEGRQSGQSKGGNLKNRSDFEGNHTSIHNEDAVAVNGILNSQMEFRANQGSESQGNISVTNTTTINVLPPGISPETFVATTTSTTSLTTMTTTSVAASETALLQCVNSSCSNPNDNSKSIIEKAMMSSFISPLKQKSASIKNMNTNVEHQSSDSFTSVNSNKNNDVCDSDQCFSNSISTSNNFKQHQQLYTSAPTILLNSLPTLASSNIILTSPVSLPVNIMSPVVNNTPVPVVPTSFVKILPSTISNSPNVVISSSVANQIVPFKSSVIACNGSGSISSSRILTSGCTSSSALPSQNSVVQYQQNSTVSSDYSKSPKILLENVGWRRKNRLHVRACNKFVKKKLTKITPKPDNYQESFYKPGGQNVLPNGITVEVLNKDTALPGVSGSLENNIDVNTSEKPTDEMKEKETKILNDNDGCDGNDSDLMVIDTSYSEILDSDLPSNIVPECSEKVVKENNVCEKTEADNEINTCSSVTEVQSINKDKSCENTEVLSSNSVNVDTYSNLKNFVSPEVSEPHNSQTKKDKTPCLNPTVNKRKSMSTPRRRTNHVRALDFGTPDRRTRPRKTNTSPKSASRMKSKLKINASFRRSGLFKSPDNKIITSSEKNVILEDETLNKINKQSDVTDSPSTLSKGGTKSDSGNFVKQALKEDNVKIIAENELIDSSKGEDSKLETVKEVKTSQENENDLESDVSALKNISDSADSPTPKLTADWDAVNGLGMIVGKINSSDGAEEKESEVQSSAKTSWDAKLRTFVNPNDVTISSTPKKKHTRRKIGSNQLKDICDSEKSVKGEGKEKSINSNNCERKIISNKSVGRNDESDQPSLTKESGKIYKTNQKVTRRIKSSVASQKSTKELTDESLSTSSSSSESSDESLSTIGNNDDLSSDLALKIERNILNCDSLSSDRKSNETQNVSITKHTSSSSGKNLSNKKVSNDSPTSVFSKSSEFISPEQYIAKNKNNSESHQAFQQLPVLETPIKFGNENVHPQTPNLTTPMLKAIEEDTKVVLLTPSFPPTPAAIKAMSICEVKTPCDVKKFDSNTHKKIVEVSPDKNDSNSLEFELIKECNRIEIYTSPKKNLKNRDFNVKVLLNSSLDNSKTKNEDNNAKRLIVSCTKLDVDKFLSPSKANFNQKPNIKLPEETDTIEKKVDSQIQEEKSFTKISNSIDENKFSKMKCKKEMKKKKISEKVTKKSKNELIFEILKNTRQEVFGDDFSSGSECEDQPRIKTSACGNLHTNNSVDEIAIKGSTKTYSSIEDHSNFAAKKPNELDHKTESTVGELSKNLKDTSTDNNTNVGCKPITGAMKSNGEVLNTNDLKITDKNLLKPKKYVKTILLSTKVSKKKSPENQRSISKAFEIDFDKESQENIESQRALLNEKRQRTIDKLKEVSVKNKKNEKECSSNVKLNSSNIFDKSKLKNLPLTNIVEGAHISSNENKDSMKNARVNDTVFEKKHQSCNKNSSSGVKGYSLNNDKTHSKDKNKSDLYSSSPPLKKQIKKTDKKISPVYEENADSSPIKINTELKENFDVLNVKEQQSADFSGSSCKAGSSENKTFEGKSQIIFLQSNEAYVHVVHDENAVISCKRKLYNIDDVEAMYALDKDNFCKVSVQPLQTLLEIFPSDYKSNYELESAKVKKQNGEIEENSNVKKSIVTNRSRHSSGTFIERHYDKSKDSAIYRNGLYDCESMSTKHKLQTLDLSKNSIVVSKKKDDENFERKDSSRKSHKIKKLASEVKLRSSSRGLITNSRYRENRLRELKDRVYARRDLSIREARYKRRFSNEKRWRGRHLRSPSEDRKSSFSGSKSPSSRHESRDKQEFCVSRTSFRRRKSTSLSPRRRSRSPSVEKGRRDIDRRNVAVASVSKVRRRSNSNSPSFIRRSPGLDRKSRTKKSLGSTHHKRRSSRSDISSNSKLIDTKKIHLLGNESSSGKTLLDNPIDSYKKKQIQNSKDSDLELSDNQIKKIPHKKEESADEDDLEDGEIVSLFGNEDENCESTPSMDLMDLAVTTESSVKRNRTLSRSSEKLKLLSPRKRKASSEDQRQGPEKRHKPDDAQRLLKNLDSEDLEQFLSAVHSETEK